MSDKKASPPLPPQIMPPPVWDSQPRDDDAEKLPEALQGILPPPSWDGTSRPIISNQSPSLGSLESRSRSSSLARSRSNSKSGSPDRHTSPMSPLRRRSDTHSHSGYSHSPAELQRELGQGGTMKAEELFVARLRQLERARAIALEQETLMKELLWEDGQTKPTPSPVPSPRSHERVSHEATPTHTYAPHGGYAVEQWTSPLVAMPPIDTMAASMLEFEAAEHLAIVRKEERDSRVFLSAWREWTRAMAQRHSSTTVNRGVATGGRSRSASTARTEQVAKNLTRVRQNRRRSIDEANELQSDGLPSKGPQPPQTADSRSPLEPSSGIQWGDGARRVVMWSVAVCAAACVVAAWVQSKLDRLTVQRTEIEEVGKRDCLSPAPPSPPSSSSSPLASPSSNGDLWWWGCALCAVLVAVVATACAVFWRNQCGILRRRQRQRVHELFAMPPCEAVMDDLLRGVCFSLSSQGGEALLSSPIGPSPVVVRGCAAPRVGTRGRPWSLTVCDAFLARRHDERTMETGEACGGAMRGAWLEVDLGGNTALWATGYCLGFGTCSAELFTHWRLDASNGSGTWITLAVHNEAHGYLPGEVKRFALTPTAQPMRLFRICPLHAASENRCLHLYHFDVFGTVCEFAPP